MVEAPAHCGITDGGSMGIVGPRELFSGGGGELFCLWSPAPNNSRENNSNNLVAAMDEALPPIILIAVIGALLLGPMVMCRRRAPEEAGLSPKYEEICSGKIGWFLWTNIPCIRFSIYENFFVVAFLKPKVFLRKGARVGQKKSVSGSHLVIDTGGEVVYRLSARKADDAVRLFRGI